MRFSDFAATELPPLLRFAGVLCGDRGLAEDVVQEVLIRVQSQWDRIGSLANPGAYVRRMIVNESLAWRRKWARIVPAAEPPLAIFTPDHAIAHAQRDELATELARLPRKQRAVLVLRYYLGVPDHEIAEILGCSEGTVRSHASRALATLRIEMTYLRGTVT